jgi:hypothetical protein
LDYQAKEDQKNRGYNLLFSLSNKSPIYSQIASQNYWNALQASQESAAQWGSLLGGAASNFTQFGMQNPPGGGGAGGNSNPWAYSSYDMNYSPGGTPYEASPYTEQGYTGYDQYGDQ